MYWKYGFRKINGKKRKVKVRRFPDGSEQVRISHKGHKVYTDKGALHFGLGPHKKGYYNATSKSHQKSRRL